MDRRRIVDIGIQSFEKLRKRNAFYIDKTGFIKDWWQNGADATLITRPRRFGKTLNLSMIECFFSNQYADRKDLFQGLSIWDDVEFRKLQGAYPVIFLSFARVKAADYTEMEYAITKIIFDAFEQNRYLLEGDLLSAKEKQYFDCIEPGMEKKIAVDAIYTLTNFISRYYNSHVIILLDEYDTPMQEAWLKGYWDKAADFFRSLFNATFKSNPYMLRGLITGITRISKESIFSDLNNLEVITTTSNKFASYFGFTESEVFQALDDMGFSEEKQGIKKWYDGFTFGSITDIYNPWSISSFIANGAVYKSYWADTSSNGLINRLVRESSADIKQHVELLLDGGHIKVPVDEQIIYDQLDEDENSIWSLLLAGGYLKVVSIDNSGIDDSLEEEKYELSLTNHEVRRMFAKMIRGWFGGRCKANYNEFIKALLEDNVKNMNLFINKVALDTFSSFDSGRRPSENTEPERFYHGFVLGITVDLADRYRIRSNRESGYGRYDVMMEPLDKKDKAFIFEFKVFNKEENETSLEDTAANALAQIEAKKYESELTARGILPENIRKYGFAFEGKKCLIST